MNKRNWAGIGLLVLIPILITGGFFWAGWDSNQRLRSSVDAAIVNLDEPVTVNGQYMPLGRQLTAALVDSSRPENLNWKLAKADDAEEGLASGKYAARVVIPKEFSALATSFAGKAEDAARATISIDTSPVAGIADAEVGRLVSLAATTTLNNTLTKGYLDQLYLGFNQMKDQYQQLADGSKKLAEGSTKLSDGLDDAADGAPQAVDGAEQLAKGGRELANGLGQMASKVKPLPAGAKKLAEGATKLAGGVTGLAGGATELAAGVTQYTGGVNQIIDTVLPLTDFLQYIEPTAQAAAQAAKDLNTAVKKFHTDMADIENDKAVIDQAVAVAKAAAAKIPCPQSIQDAGLCDDFKQAVVDGAGAAAKQGVIAGGHEIAKALEATDSKGRSVLSVAQQIEDQAATLPAAAKKLTAELEAMIKPITDLRKAGDDLADGASKLADGTTALTGGASELAAGVNKFAAGIPALTKGIKQSATGADKLADGIEEYAAGISPLANGLPKLASGSAELTDGLQQMADGIATGQDEIPSYSETDREALSAAVAGPVSTDGMDALAVANLGWGSVLLVLALWLGALACNTVLRRNRQLMLNSNASSLVLIWQLLRPMLTIMAVQTLVLVVVAQATMRLPLNEFALLTGLLFIAGISFTLINYALASWLGNLGRLLSLICAVFFATVALTNALPEFFVDIRGALPLTPVLQGVRGIITGASGVDLSFAATMAWVAFAGVASFVFILKSRATTLERLLARP
ncbi:MAG: YhgE/Pip domain-containing protein [Propionibacteriaceae bacterium]|jgi:putative membrane protein|nr:YhgE/Pip domain-containing protein [Propionibacteriaceae bacterium]